MIDWLANDAHVTQATYDLRTSFLFARRLVDNGAVLQAAQIKHAHAAILSAAHKYVDALSAETHVVNFLVVSNQLRLGRERRYIPDCARSIDARSDYETRGDGIPVQRRQWGRVVGGLGVRQKRQRCQFRDGLLSAISRRYR